jgi:hypothetical protein
MNENPNQTAPAVAANSSFAKASCTLGLISVLFNLCAILMVMIRLSAPKAAFPQAALGLFLAAFFAGGAAVICAWWAAWQINKSGGGLRGAELARIGAIMGYLSVAIFLLSLTLPNLFRARSFAAKSACVNNLRQLEGAKEQWALENKKTPADTPTFDDLVGTDKYIKVTPSCPAQGAYTLGNMATKPRCSIDGPGHSLLQPDWQPPARKDQKPR